MSRPRTGFRAAKIGRAQEAWRHALETRGELESDVDGVKTYRVQGFHDVRDGMQEYQDQTGPIPHDPAEIRRLKNICTECSEEGHRARYCPERKCRACGILGHSWRDCPGAGS